MSRLRELPPEQAQQLSIYSRSRHLDCLKEARLNLAACLFRQGKIEEAKSLYEEIHRQPAGPTGHANALYIGLADCYDALGDNPESQETILLEGLATIPGDIRLNQDLEDSTSGHMLSKKQFPSIH